MRLILVRHGEAKSEAEDLERPLTDQGKREVKQVAQWAARKKIRTHEIRHSGKKRAEQTASILGGFLDPLNGVFPVSGLGPNHDVLPIAQLLTLEESPLMLVGHLPFLSRLASHLLVDNPNISLLQFPTAAMVCLEKMDNQWTLAWVITPDLV